MLVKLIRTALIADAISTTTMAQAESVKIGFVTTLTTPAGVIGEDQCARCRTLDPQIAVAGCWGGCVVGSLGEDHIAREGGVGLYLAIVQLGEVVVRLVKCGAQRIASAVIDYCTDVDYLFSHYLAFAVTD